MDSSQSNSSDFASSDSADLSTREDLQRFRPFLKALAERELEGRLRPKFDASDIVQQTMLQAMLAEKQWRGQDDASKAGWLRAILRNVVHGVSRRFHRPGRSIDCERGIGSSGDTSHAAGELAENHTSPSLVLQSEEERQRIAAAIEKLTPEQRRVLILRYWEEQSLAEIAHSLEKSQDAIAGLLYRAMKVMRSELA